MRIGVELLFAAERKGRRRDAEFEVEGRMILVNPSCCCC